MIKRPISVTIISWFFILMGVLSNFDTISHWNMYRASGRPASDWIVGFLVMELTRILAIVAGILMLRRNNFGRWLCVVWLAFHVVISIRHSITEVAMHAVFLFVLIFFLFRRPANEYFRGY